MPWRIAYTRDLLTRTAAESTGLVDMLRRLGVPPGSGPRSYLRTRLLHYGIDVSHFADEPLPERERRSYPRELLEEAAVHCHSIREMLVYMKAPVYDSSYSHIRKKLERFGIDTSHFTSGRRCGLATVPRAELAAAVSASYSVAGVLKALGQRPDNGAARTRVKRGIDAYGLSTAHFTGPVSYTHL